MLKAKENVEKVNEARQAAAEENVPMSEPMEEDEGPQVAGEATSAMHDVANFQDNEDGGPSLEESVSSLNADQATIFERIKEHFEHQVQHEKNMCKCSDLKPLDMFVSGVGGTGKSFLIKVTPSYVLLQHQRDLQHSIWVESPFIDCCSSPLNMRVGQLVTGNWEKMQ